MTDPTPCASEDRNRRSLLQRVGLAVGVAALLVILSLPIPDAFVEHAAGALSLPAHHSDAIEAARGAQSALALLALMVIWWISEAVPLAVTALLPGLLLPLLHVSGVREGRLFAYDARAAFAPFASPVIYLFLAGFLLAAAMRKTGLDRRITLALLSRRWVMRGPGRILLAAMGITAFLSMWISNTATAALMLPIALMILRQLGASPGGSRFGIALMFGIAWSASIGGLGTLIGSPPNGIVVGILQERGIADIDFLQWTLIGLPVAAMGLLAAWVMLMIRFRPTIQDPSEGLRSIRRARSELGPVSIEEKTTVLVFTVAVILWLTQPFWLDLLPRLASRRVERLGTAEIGLFCALLLFIAPLGRRRGGPVLTWRDAHYVDWGILLLFGGGIALSGAMFTTGLSDVIAKSFVNIVGRPGPWMSLVLLVLLVDFLTEITSNTAVTSMMTPVLIGLAGPLGLSPLTLCLACAMASSLAFMLPVATPPNAIIYSSGYFRVHQMARAGFFMNLIGCLVLVGCLYLFGGRLLGTSSLQ